MPNRTTDLYFEDHFNRADNATVGNGWTTTGGLEIVKQNVRRNSASGNTSKLIRTAPDTVGDNYRVTARHACTSDSNSPVAAVEFRRKNVSGGGTEGYGVELVWTSTGVRTLRIIKRLSGSSTTLTSATVTTELNDEPTTDIDISVYQTIAGQATNTENGVKIEAFLNDEERPRLTYTDNSYPLFTDKGLWAFGWDEKAVADTIVLDWIALEGLEDATSSLLPAITYYTFGKLKSVVRNRALRASSAGTLEDSYFGELVNETSNWLNEEIGGRPYWLEHVYDFTWPANALEFALPADTAYVDDTIWDTTSNINYSFIQEEDFRQATGQETTGTPYLFRLGGETAAGEPLIRAYPTPTADTPYRLRLHRWPRFLVDDTDVPDLPQRFCGALIEGAVYLYTMRDTDRTHLAAAQSNWMRWVKRIKVACRRRDQIAAKPKINSGFRRQSIFGWNQIATAKYGIRR